MIVLDYSKSMYARDVAPSRIARAKAEVARLIRDLPGARFGAVAFAGEPMSFPLTSDGAAIAQFFRQLEPNDMPVGGTAIARALERARELLARDPKSKEHVRVIVLVTDGEDLEGDPVARRASSCAEERTRIDVVQIGGRAPEPIPEVGRRRQGHRHPHATTSGKPLTTELSAEGEAQLAEDRARRPAARSSAPSSGETGIDEVARGLSKMMREELAERVETVFDEEYCWPLGVALVLLARSRRSCGEAPGASRGPCARCSLAASRRWATVSLIVLLVDCGAVDRRRRRATRARACVARSLCRALGARAGGIRRARSSARRRR